MRRLYGRREGMQPPKVRWTRAALAKMYAKGGLFDQAIAELRAAIDEDPNRPDLQLLLAQMFFQTFQAMDAVGTRPNIERLDWKPGLQISDATTQPTWATSLGVSLDKPTEEKFPDWLKDAEAPVPDKAAEPDESDEKTQPSVSPFIWDTQEVKKIITDTPTQEEEIPDWMK